MQATGQYGVADVPQFVVGRVPSAHSHMFTLSHDMSTLSPNSSARAPQQLHPSQPEQHPHHSQQHPLQQQHQQNNNQMVAQKIRLGSDSPEVPSPTLVPPLMNADTYNGNNNNSNNGSNNNNNNNHDNHKQAVPIGDDDVLIGGEDSERGSAGNRWPRQETLALLKIRSEMDANFRDASLKGPLWEEVSRRLAELGYFRSGKKCKEKFENVHKYYKRTKEGRAGRQDGKSYRFFSQLEALYGNSHGGGSISNKVTVAAICGEGNLPTAAPLISAHHPVQGGINKSSSQINNCTPAGGAAAKGSTGLNPTNPTIGTAQQKPPAMFDFSAAISFSSDSSDADEDDYDDEPAGEDKLPDDININRKRKRTSSFSLSMMMFFENLMKQVVERQEAMQQKFLEAIEKREQDRMIREEAWKRQEMARLSREQEIKSQERSLTASRDAALVAFLQKVTGQTLQIPQLPAVPQLLPTPGAENMPNHHQHLHELVMNNNNNNNYDNDNNNNHRHDKEIMSFDPNSKRWPKPEVLALIKIRSGMEQRFHEAGPKGPLWEEVSAGMSCLGFNRSAKRCKEKWENINKYFRKAKESNKKRPENAKTCPYFHQLDALYRKKILGMNHTATDNNSKQIINMNGADHEQDQEDHHRNLAVQMNRDDHDREMDDEDEEDDDDQEHDRQEELAEQQQQQQPPSGSHTREDSAGQNQGRTDGSDQLLGMMQQQTPPALSDAPVPHHHNAGTYDRSNSSTATTRDNTSFMAMVHKLTADPPEFNMSTSSNTE